MKEIRSIISAYDKADHAMEKLALASVVMVEESSYRRVGARMFVSSNGQWTGGISGGCLEGDALRRAQSAIYKDIPSVVVYDTLDDDSNEIGVGLGCNGKIHVLFTPINTENPDNVIEQLRRVVQWNEAALFVQVIGPEKDNSLLSQSQVNRITKPIKGFAGIDLSYVSDRVRDSRILRRPQIIEVEHDTDKTVQILVEYIRPEMNLCVIGDNYDVLALCSLVKSLGWYIKIVGRKKKMTKTMYNFAKGIYEYEEFENVPHNEQTVYVLMTHDLAKDVEILPKILARNPKYLGMLGPRKRLHKIEEQLHSYNFSKIPYFHSPVGLDLGAETPEEIALSILSEILSVVRERDASSLRDRQEPIHKRW